MLYEVITIGVACPVSVRVDTFGTGTVDDAAIERAVERVFDFRPAAIIDALKLRRPIRITSYNVCYTKLLRHDGSCVDRHPELAAAVRERRAAAHLRPKGTREDRDRDARSERAHAGGRIT